MAVGKPERGHGGELMLREANTVSMGTLPRQRFVPQRAIAPDAIAD
jgi:hypothetical protein